MYLQTVIDRHRNREASAQELNYRNVLFASKSKEQDNASHNDNVKNSRQNDLRTL